MYKVPISPKINDQSDLKSASFIITITITLCNLYNAAYKAGQRRCTEQHTIKHDKITLKQS